MCTCASAIFMTNRNGQDQEHGVAMHSHSRQGEIVLASYELTTHTSAHFLLWRQKKRSLLSPADTPVTSKQMVSSQGNKAFLLLLIFPLSDATHQK